MMALSPHIHLFIRWRQLLLQARYQPVPVDVDQKLRRIDPEDVELIDFFIALTEDAQSLAVLFETIRVFSKNG